MVGISSKQSTSAPGLTNSRNLDLSNKKNSEKLKKTTHQGKKVGLAADNTGRPSQQKRKATPSPAVNTPNTVQLKPSRVKPHAPSALPKKPPPPENKITQKNASAATIDLTHPKIETMKEFLREQNKSWAKIILSLKTNSLTKASQEKIRVQIKKAAALIENHLKHFKEPANRTTKEEKKIFEEMQKLQKILDMDNPNSGLHPLKSAMRENSATHTGIKKVETSRETAKKAAAPGLSNGLANRQRKTAGSHSSSTSKVRNNTSSSKG